MLLGLFISPQVPVSDPRHSDMGGTLGHGWDTWTLCFGLNNRKKFQKIVESDTWTRTWIPESEQHSFQHDRKCLS